jgi:hypothetical protein
VRLTDHEAMLVRDHILRREAIHEAGHAVVGQVLGNSVRWVAIAGNGKGRSSHVDAGASPWTRAVGAMAGEAAELHYLRCSGLSLSRRYLGGWRDRKQVVGLGIDPKVARLEADRLVTEHWVAIVRVALKLHDAAVFEPDVVEALGGSDDEIRAAAERGRRRDEATLQAAPRSAG